VKVPYQGKQIDAEEVETLSSDEKWNTYKLADGRWLSVKIVLVRCIKAVKDKTPEGEPLYIVNTQTIIKVKE
jgi:hypothetical protein